MRSIRIVVAVVLALGLAISATAQDRGAQLRAAVFAGDIAGVHRLSTSKVTVNAASAEGVTPLMIAAALGRTDIAAELLMAGANIEARTKDLKATALMFAADYGRMGVAALLVAANANLKAVDRDGYSPVDYTVVPNTGETQEAGDLVLAVGKFLSGEGVPMKMTAENSSTILFLADPDRLKILIDRQRK